MEADELRKLVEAHGSYAAAARAAGVPSATLKHRAHKLGIQSPHPRATPIAPAVPLNQNEPDAANLTPVRAYQHRAWGLGGPQTLDLPPKPGGRYTVIGIFDLHGYWREEALFQAQLRMIRALKPDLTILGGDIDNFDILSRWSEKELKRLTPLKLLRAVADECDEGLDIRRQVRDAVGGAALIEVEGNHGERLRSYLDDDIHVAWEEALRFRKLLRYVDEYYTRAGVFIRPGFLVRHGDTTAQYPAAKEMRDKDVSGWSGHLHKVDVSFDKYRPLTGSRRVHTIGPCSCRLDTNYGSGNAGLMGWHQGVLVGSFSADDPEDHVTDVGLWNGRELIVRGAAY